MKALVFALAVSSQGCHSSPKIDSAAASSAPGSAAAPSRATPPIEEANPMPPSAAPVEQPKRSAADSVRMLDAERAINDAITHAKASTSLKDACSGLDTLTQKVGQLQLMTPPPGFERAFNEQSGGIGTMLDVMRDERCSDARLDAETIREELAAIQREFIKLQGIGAQR